MRGSFIVFAVAIVLSLAAGAIRRVFAGKALFARIPPGAIFAETGCSAQWERTWSDLLTRRFMVNHFIIAYVANGRLVITPYFPISLSPTWGNGLCDIDVPVSQIAHIKTARWTTDDVLRIKFIDPSRRSIELLVRNEAALLTALGPEIAGETRRTADRPLYTGASTTRISHRLILLGMAFVGAVVMIGSTASLLGDHAVRANGIATTGEFAGYNGLRGTVHYQVDGDDYTLASVYGRGLWQSGQTETVIYVADDPSRSVEGKSAVGWVMLILLGGTMLIVGLFSRRLATRPD